MRVESIATLGFRNLEPAQLELGAGLTLLWGPNGAGKTNLLEAVCFALTAHSPRTRSDRELIRFGEPLARAEAALSDPDAAGGRRVFLAAVSHADGRRRLVDGASPAADVNLRRPPLAIFLPDRLAVVKGAPSVRRSHLDAFSAATWPGRVELRRRYGRALAQRNALLGRVRAGRAPASALDAWDRELAAAGVELIATRAEAVALLAPGFAEAAGELGLAGEPRLEYRPRSEVADAEQLAAELADRRAADLERGYTGWGPHLDELALTVDGRALRRYGSQGQQRLALLALLFAERAALLAAGRPPPLMLLDDVTSELDGERRELLCRRLAGGGQAVLTATEAGHLPAGPPRTQIAVRAGRAIGELAAAA